jgi:hypothetical protein
MKLAKIVKNWEQKNWKAKVKKGMLFISYPKKDWNKEDALVHLEVLKDFLQPVYEPVSNKDNWVWRRPLSVRNKKGL